MKSLTERHRPQTLDDIRGHPSAIDSLESWIENWTPGDKPQFLYGPPGTGKTSTAEAMANDYDLTFLEINASSARTKDDIEDIARQIKVGNPSGEAEQLIFIDEADSLSTTTTPLGDALEDPKNPVIVVANDKYEVPDSITNKCDEHSFSLQKRSIKKAVREIAEEEGIELSKKELGKLSTRNGLRDALNDLDRHADGDAEIGWDEREMDIGEFEATRNIIEEKKYTGPDVTPPDLILWLDENLSGHLEGLEQAVAYDALSRADVWVGRAQKTENYRWWAYAAELAEQCANLRITEPYDGYTRISFPTWFRSKGDTYRSNNNTVKLYKKLKRKESGIFEFSGDYFYFKEVLLPFIRELDEEEKYKFVYGYKLEEKEADEIGVDYGDYEDWKESGVNIVREDEDSDEEEFEVEEEDADEEEEDEEMTVLDF